MKISKASDDMDDHRDKPIVHYIKVETGVNKDDLSQTSHSTRNADPSSDTDCINALLLPPNGTCCHIRAANFPDYFISRETGIPELFREIPGNSRE